MKPDNPDTSRRMPDPPDHTCAILKPSGFPCGRPAVVQVDNTTWICGHCLKTFNNLRLQALKSTLALPGMPPPVPKQHGSPRQSGQTKPHQGGHSR